MSALSSALKVYGLFSAGMPLFTPDLHSRPQAGVMRQIDPYGFFSCNDFEMIIKFNV